METLSINRTNSILRDGKVSKSACRRERKNVHGFKANPQPFLTEKIDSIRAMDLIAGIISDMDVAPDERANAVNLISATARWLGLHDFPIPDLSGKDLYETLSKCYQAIQPHLPASHGLNIDFNHRSNEFVLIEHAPCDFPSYTVFFFPLASLNKYKGAIRKVLADFVSLLYLNGPYEWPDESYDFSLTLEIHEYDDHSPDEDIAKFIEIYRRGEFMELRKEIMAIQPEGLPERILSGIDRLPQSDKDTFAALLESIRQGINILSEGDIMSFRYFPDDCTIPSMTNDDEDSILTLDRLFVMCYSIDGSVDPIFDYALSSISEESNIIACEDAMDYHILSKDDQSIFIASDYPERWTKWYDQFLTHYE